MLIKLFKIDINPNRIYGLDILRALAILFVVMAHGEYLVPNMEYTFLNYFIFDGVAIFFVLSGFLIGGILIRTLNSSVLNTKLLLNFWIRRWFRTLPNYFLILLVLLLLEFTFTEHFSILAHKRYFLFAQNLFSPHPEFFPEAWSLSIEEWFYLLVPIALFGLIKWLRLSVHQSILITAVSIILCVTLFRYLRYDSQIIDSMATWDSVLRKQVFTRLDSLMYGVLGAYALAYHNAFWNSYKTHFLVAGLSLFIVTEYNLLGFNELGLFHSVFSFSATSLATLLVIPYLNNLKQGKGMVHKSITYISLISYSMYLVNFTLVQKWILGRINWSPLIDFNPDVFFTIRYVLFWACTVVLSILIYKYFEVPTMNLRNRFKIK